MTLLLREFESFRRLMDAYWCGRLNADQERTIESEVKEETRIGYKPLPHD